MRYTVAAAVMAGVAAASWSPDMGSHGGYEHGAAPPSNGTWGGDSYTTEVVTAFTTYCPQATEITHGGETYTATEATTLTITNCPDGCTVTKPVSSAPPAETPYSPVTTTEEETPVAPTPYSSEAPPASSTPVAPVPVYPTNNGTVPAPAPSGTGSYTSATEGSPIAEQTGNSASTLSAGAAGILAVFGLVAAL